MGLFSDIFGGGSKSTTSPDRVWGPQANVLQGLYGSGIQRSSDAYNYLQGQLPGLQQPGMAAYNSLAGLSQVGNPFVMNQISQLGQQFGDFFNNQLLPGLRDNYYQAGQTLGPGSRYGFQSNDLGGQVAREFGTAATNLLADSSRQAIAAGAALPGVGDYLQGAGLNAFLGPYMGLAGILGTGPTVLGGGGSSSSKGGLFGPINLGFSI